MSFTVMFSEGSWPRNTKRGTHVSNLQVHHVVCACVYVTERVRMYVNGVYVPGITILWFSVRGQGA